MHRHACHREEAAAAVKPDRQATQPDREHTERQTQQTQTEREHTEQFASMWIDTHTQDTSDRDMQETKSEAHTCGTRTSKAHTDANLHEREVRGANRVDMV